MKEWAVIIPTYNEAVGIDQLLKSLATIPTKKTVEFIVVDGGSQDQTVAIASQYATVYQMKEGNRGVQLAYGANQSTAKNFWFLHGDATIPQGIDLFSEMSNLLKKPNISAGFFPLFFKTQSNKKSCFFTYLEWTSNQRAAHLGLIFGDQGLFVSREKYQLAGGFPKVPLMEDWILSRNLAKLGKFISHSQKLDTSARRFEANGKLKTHLKMHWLKIKFIIGIQPEQLAKSYRKERKS